jgi:ribosomal protein S18 acetylase RimI-like enzyme
LIRYPLKWESILLNNAIKYEILQATLNDWPGISSMLYRAWIDTYINEEYGVTQEVIDEFFKIRNSPEKIAERIERMSHPTPNEHMFLAKVRGQVVGMIRILIHSDRNEIKALYVDPACHRLGIATDLVFEGQKHFNHENKSVVVWVAVYNKRAIDFYRYLGFEETGQQMTFDLPHGISIPEIEMSIEKWRLFSCYNGGMSETDSHAKKRLLAAKNLLLESTTNARKVFAYSAPNCWDQS